MRRKQLKQQQELSFELEHDQMYIVTAPCWKCKEAVNVAMIKGDGERRKSLCGPEAFSREEIELAQNNGAIIAEHYSQMREERYNANTCPHCGTFIGQFYLFLEYFQPAQYGDYKYTLIDLPKQ